MEDLTGKLNEMLNDPETMSQIQALAGLLGQSMGEEPAPSPPPKTDGGAENSVSPEMFQMFARMMPLLSQMNQEDNNTRFLQALRPLLQEERQQKLDQAVKFLQILSVLPYLREAVLF